MFTQIIAVRKGAPDIQIDVHYNEPNESLMTLHVTINGAWNYKFKRQ